MLFNLPSRVRIAQVFPLQPSISLQDASRRTITRRSNGFWRQSPFFRSNVQFQRSLRSRILHRTFSNRRGVNRWQTQDSAMRATWAIIGLNTAMFGIWQYAIAYQDRQLLRRLSNNATLSWENIRNGRYYTAITSAFTHTDLSHFAFNMIAFYAFGSIVSWVPGVGGVHIISLAVGSAISGSIAWLYQRRNLASAEGHKWGPFAQHIRQVQSALGASGMVMGAGAAATCLMPTAPMYLMFIPIPIPLWVVTALYAALDISYLDSGDRIGHAAHLGGSVYGVLYYLAYLRGYGGIWRMLARNLRR